MERQLVTIEKRIYTANEHRYNLYLIPEVQNGEEVVTLCMNKEGYTNMTFIIRFSSKESSYQEINDYIDTHLNVFIRQTDAEIRFPNFIDVNDMFDQLTLNYNKQDCKTQFLTEGQMQNE